MDSDVDDPAETAADTPGAADVDDGAAVAVGGEPVVDATEPTVDLAADASDASDPNDAVDLDDAAGDASGTAPAPGADPAAETIDPAGAGNEPRSTSRSAGRPKPDPTVLDAVAPARAALLAEVAADDVGEHLGAQIEAERVATHLFACTRRGYLGWRWSVTVARASRAKQVTVDEIVLVPGEQAIVAPTWLPWRERIRPGDLSPGDVLPVADDDPRLVPTYSFGDDPLDADDRAQVRQVAAELGLGRVRTLSVEGRELAAQRWYDGDGGPDSALAQSVSQHCDSCGFLVRIAGALAETFGVCANGDANDDGRAVSLDHGCGAHSEVRLAKRHEPQPLPDHVFDTLTLDGIDLR